MSNTGMNSLDFAESPIVFHPPTLAEKSKNMDEKKDALELQKLESRLIKQVGQAIGDFNMIEEGDKVMVCLSGGKDSYGLLNILRILQQRAPISFSIIAVNLDQKQPGFPQEILPNYLKSIGVDFHIEEQDTYSIVKRVIPEGKTTCSLCSRLRRGILYRVAGELGATKIALGHHKDDILQTLLLNLFYGGRIKGMPPKLVSDSGDHTVIRPLAYARERDLARYADAMEFPIIPCNLCGSQENLKRKEMAQLLTQWEKHNPKWIANLFTSLSTVVPSHLMDRQLFPFETITPDNPQGAATDTAFDGDDAC